VYLGDVNGPRGGADKRCRIVVHLPPGGRAVVSGTATDPYAAVARTAQRSAHAVKRHLKRKRSFRQRHRGGGRSVRTTRAD
jgi:hypothetical protein